jgi:hypothetical protein
LSLSVEFLTDELLGGKRVGKLLILIESEHCDDGCH